MAPTIVIAAGGTAGHVVPALAVADALRAEGAHVVFVGGERAERTMVPEAGYELRPIAVEGLSRSNPLKAARAALKAGAAVGAARRILRDVRPDAGARARAATSRARSVWRQWRGACRSCWPRPTATWA
jgi:UDP-N-acetylglucosamine--N-acetylmuramyl-(pentapeptide) pyrophosphoryl-undecaprenol N-acetylglucosamine transferase